MTSAADTIRERLLIAYPIPFENLGERFGLLRVPKDLTAEEAVRIKQMIDALVIAEPSGA